MLSCFLKRCSHFKFLHIVLPTAFQGIKSVVKSSKLQGSEVLSENQNELEHLIHTDQINLDLEDAYFLKPNMTNDYKPITENEKWNRILGMWRTQVPQFYIWWKMAISVLKEVMSGEELFKTIRSARENPMYLLKIMGHMRIDTATRAVLGRPIEHAWKFGRVNTRLNPSFLAAASDLPDCEWGVSHVQLDEDLRDRVLLPWTFFAPISDGLRILEQPNMTQPGIEGYEARVPHRVDKPTRTLREKMLQQLKTTGNIHQHIKNNLEGGGGQWAQKFTSNTFEAHDEKKIICNKGHLDKYFVFRNKFGSAIVQEVKMGGRLTQGFHLERDIVEMQKGFSGSNVAKVMMTRFDELFAGRVQSIKIAEEEVVANVSKQHENDEQMAASAPDDQGGSSGSNPSNSTTKRGLSDLHYPGRPERLSAIVKAGALDVFAEQGIYGHQINAVGGDTLPRSSDYGRRLLQVYNESEFADWVKSVFARPGIIARKVMTLSNLMKHPHYRAYLGIFESVHSDLLTRDREKALFKPVCYNEEGEPPDIASADQMYNDSCYTPIRIVPWDELRDKRFNTQRVGKKIRKMLRQKTGYENFQKYLDIKVIALSLKIIESRQYAFNFEWWRTKSHILKSEWMEMVNMKLNGAAPLSEGTTTEGELRDKMFRVTAPDYAPVRSIIAAQVVDIYYAAKIGFIKCKDSCYVNNDVVFYDVLFTPHPPFNGRFGALGKLQKGRLEASHTACLATCANFDTEMAWIRSNTHSTKEIVANQALFAFNAMVQGTCETILRAELAPNRQFKKKKHKFFREPAAAACEKLPRPLDVELCLKLKERIKDMFFAIGHFEGREAHR